MAKRKGKQQLRRKKEKLTPGYKDVRPWIRRTKKYTGRNK